MGNCTERQTETRGSSSTPLFTNTFYRIPALIYIDETFLAFAEKRTSLKDEDATLLVLNRGIRQNGSVQWSGVQELTAAHMTNYRTMNPCPVYDQQKKILFLFFNCVYDRISEQEQINRRSNKAKLCYITSSDRGETWTELTDVTERVIGEEIKHWATFSVGPGHGLQMNDGRLIVPAYVYYINRGVKPYSFAFYSDDHGSNWRFGNKLSVTSSECEMAEVRNKDKTYLYCSARGSGGYRVEAWSEDRGENFKRIQSNGPLVEPPNGCQGSVVSLQHGTETWLMFSHTTDKKTRKNLGVYLNKSCLDPRGWSEPRIINPCSSGYSDVVQCAENQFACLLESKTENCEEIVFMEIPLDIMTKP